MKKRALLLLLPVSLSWAELTLQRDISGDKQSFIYCVPNEKTIDLELTGNKTTGKVVTNDTIYSLTVGSALTFETDKPFHIQLRAPWDSKEVESVTLSVKGAQLSDEEKLRTTVGDTVGAAVSRQKEEVEEYKRNNPALRDTGEIVAIEEGKPVYLDYFNVAAAKSSHVDKLHPGGILGTDLTGKTLPPYGLWDDGIAMVDHQEYAGRIISAGDTNVVALHGTHVAGTIIGSGTLDSKVRGIAYEGRVKSYCRNNDLVEMSQEAYENGMIVSQHSYGWTTTNNYMRHWDYLAYYHPHYFISKSAGNFGQQGFHSVARYSNSKNIMVVGNVDDLPNGYSSPADIILDKRSSKGPTHDGRIKPDIVANGVDVWSACGWGADKIVYYSGTSMSGPVVAATAGLLQELYYKTHENIFMRSSTVKALLINSAFEAGNADGPDYKFGWGLLNAEGAAETIIADSLYSHGLIREITCKSSDTVQLSFKVRNPEKARVTLAWHDDAPAGDEKIESPVLINDFDMEVTTSTGTLKPWVRDQTKPLKDPATRGDNSIDNVERIDLHELKAGDLIRVKISCKNDFTEYRTVSLVGSGLEPVESSVALLSSKQIIKGAKMEQQGSSLSLQGFSGVARLSIYSVNGRELFSASVTEGRVALPDILSAAHYVVKVSTNEWSEQKLLLLK